MDHFGSVTAHDAHDLASELNASHDLTHTMIRVWRALHAQPELSNQEFLTTALLETELAAAGVESRRIGATGIVADLPGDPNGGTVALRADLDALPISEETTLTFRSQVPGVMHACGHDAHAAMLLGALLTAQQMPDRPGTIRAIFQPAEEAEPLGARAVIAGGHLKDVRAALALHVDPQLPPGRIALRGGVMMASSDVFRITVTGRSSHAGWPQLGADAIAASAALIHQAQATLSRRIDPRIPVALNFGRIHGGAAYNVIADHVLIEGVIRTLNETTRSQVRELLGEVVTSTCQAFGARGELTVAIGEPTLVNDTYLAGLLRRAGEAVLGREGVCDMEQPTMSGEDFAFYGLHVPVAMAWIGVGGREQADSAERYPLHHPLFSLDESAIPLGAAVLLRAGLAVLQDCHRRT